MNPEKESPVDSDNEYPKATNLKGVYRISENKLRNEEYVEILQKDAQPCRTRLHQT